MAEIHMTEARQAPADSLAFGYGAMLPLLAAAAAAWLLDPPWSPLGVALGILWSGAILVFLAGVRRGLSFRTPGGPTLAQLAVMLWLFLAGLVAIALPWAEPALGLLILGFASLGILDPIAARRGEAPPYFARLRPVQTALAVAALAALLLRVLRAG